MANTQFHKMADFSDINNVEDVQIELGNSGDNDIVRDSLILNSAALDDQEYLEDRGVSFNPKVWIDDIKKDFIDMKNTGIHWNEGARVLLRALLGEGLCTLIFMYVVMGAHINLIRTASNTSDIVVTRTSEDFVLGALSTAFVAVALIYSFADVSGAHFNPAVTVAVMATRKTSIRKGLAYIFIQLVAATLATLLLVHTFPDYTGTFSKFGTLNLCIVTIDSRVGPGVALVMEIILTFILVYVIFATAFDTVDTKNAVSVANVPKSLDAASRASDKSIGKNLTIYTTSGSSKAGFAPIAIGFTLGFLTFIGGSVSGGAFNPARVFGPALVSGDWTNHWVYWCGDIFGAVLAGFTQYFFAHKAVQSSNHASTTNKA